MKHRAPCGDREQGLQCEACLTPLWASCRHHSLCSGRLGALIRPGLWDLALRSPFPCSESPGLGLLPALSVPSSPRKSPSRAHFSNTNQPRPLLDSHSKPLSTTLLPQGQGPGCSGPPHLRAHTVTQSGQSSACSPRLPFPPQRCDEGSCPSTAPGSSASCPPRAPCVVRPCMVRLPHPLGLRVETLFSFFLFFLIIFLNLFILFIFGCVGSSLLHAGFL